VTPISYTKLLYILSKKINENDNHKLNALGKKIIRLKKDQSS
jgi:hypothetical protein